MKFYHYILISIIIIIILSVSFLLNFYRDPDRETPKGNNIISPADGKILKIMPFKAEELKIKKGLLGRIYTLTNDTTKDGYLISIFMSPFDVHVNRAPVNGTIVSKKHSKGKFLSADSLAALENEKSELIINNTKLGKVKVIQIAGALARRIETWPNMGDEVKKGQRIGRIKLGSQVTLILPKNIDIKIKENQKVKAGETILAEIK